MKNKYILIAIAIILVASCKNNHNTELIKSNKVSDTLTQTDSEINSSKINDFNTNIDGFDYTQLGLNCKNNNVQLVEKLISNGADLTKAKKNNIYEYDALYVAIENKHLKIINLLINKKAKINQLYDEEGLTPLVLACKLNDIEIVKLLLKNGANVNGIELAETDYKLTPLLMAIDNNNLGIAKLLLESGANKLLTDQNGNPLLSIASKKGEQWQKIFAGDSSDINKIFEGVYNFEASNKDKAKTIFDIIIKSINDISININDDGSKENYTHIKGEKINDNKIKIIYNNTLEDDMGVIFLEKKGEYFYISGNPIYFINPGNNEYKLKKIKS